jgi:hypothetical protein
VWHFRKIKLLFGVFAACRFCYESPLLFLWAELALRLLELAAAGVSSRRSAQRFL